MLNTTYVLAQYLAEQVQRRWRGRLLAAPKQLLLPGTMVPCYWGLVLSRYQLRRYLLLIPQPEQGLWLPLYDVDDTGRCLPEPCWSGRLELSDPDSLPVLLAQLYQQLEPLCSPQR